MQLRVPTGSASIDQLIGGGLDVDCITTLFGPAGSGKTNLAMLASVQVAKLGKKVIYIDTEGGFSVERLRQLSEGDDKIHKNILFLKPTNFKEQISAMNKLKKLVDSNIGLIVIDTISMLYRLKLGKREDAYDINRALGKQIAYLTEIARKQKIPVLITNQVYSNFDERDEVKMVGGDLLHYGSKCLIELQITPSNKRRAILKKHRSMKPEETVTFKIVESGTLDTRESKGFSLFRN
jgi:DNA repair protein RadB